VADPLDRSSLEPGPPMAAWVVIGVGSGLLVATLLLQWRSVLQARAALTAIGIVGFLAALLRPAALWNAGTTRLWRDAVGDELTVWLMTAASIGIVVFAWVYKMGQ
jgi:hypothetical protein